MGRQETPRWGLSAFVLAALCAALSGCGTSSPGGGGAAATGADVPSGGGGGADATPGAAGGAAGGGGPGGQGGAAGAGGQGGGCGGGAALEVLGIDWIRDDIKSVDWSAALDLLASEGTTLDAEGYYDVYVFEPDGSSERCLTCDHPEVPKHNGNPAWHPSGEWVAFTGQKLDTEPGGSEKQCVPGKGLYHDLWVVDYAGTKLVKLDETDAAQSQRLIHPQFSHDGTVIAWAVQVHNYETPDDPTHHWGEWEIRIGDFVVEQGEPSVQNVWTCQPGAQQQFFETHGFSADGTKLVFSGNLEPGQPPVGMDIHTLDVSSHDCGSWTRLTQTQDDWDEHGHFSPNEQWLAWISSEGFDIQYEDVMGLDGYDLWGMYLKTELTIMPASNGWGARQRLTSFNEQGDPGSRTIVADSAWSPDSHRIAASVTSDAEDEGATRDLYMIEIEYCEP